MKPTLTFTENEYSLAIGSTVLQKLHPVLVWRYPGGEWVVEPGRLVARQEAAGSFLLEYAFTCLSAHITLAPDGQELHYSGQMVHGGGPAVELARFHLFEGELSGGFSFRAYQSVSGNTRVYTGADQLKSFNAHFEGLWQSYAEYWLRLPEPYHDTPNWAVSGDVGFFFGEEEPFTMGFYAPGTAAGEVGYKTGCGAQSSVYAAVLLDNILFEAGEARTLEQLAVLPGPGDAGFGRWADLCTTMMTPRPSKPLLGFCSWYRKFSNIDEAIFLQAVEEFSALTDVDIPVVVQLDDGYQLMPGTWDVPNERFAKSFRQLPARIKETGAVPGLWLAPTTIWCNHPLAKQHPDAVQHCADGSYPIHFVNWGWCQPEVKDGKTLFLEPGHPVTNEMIRKSVADAVAAGWRYLKIDFTYCISERRQAYDRKHTAFEHQRELYRIARQAAGEDVTICACICGLFRHAIGYADTQRIGGDVVATVESFKTSLADCITRASVGGRWWTADTDVFYMREIEGLGLEQKWIWTGTVGALGSVFLTSDMPSEWDEEARRRIGYYWRSHGVAPPQTVRILYGEDHTITALFVDNEHGRRVLLYNWRDADADVQADLSGFGLLGAPQSVFPADVAYEAGDGRLLCRGMKPFSMRLFEF